MRLIDIIKAALIGKKLEHTNQYGRTVALRIEDVKVENYSQEYEIEPASPENDFWPKTSVRNWQDLSIIFEDGSSITKNWSGKFKFVEDYKTNNLRGE